MNVDELLRDPKVLGGAGAVLLLLVVAVVLYARRDRGPKGRVVDDTKARARIKVREDLRAFRDDLKRAVAAAAPVFQKIAQETDHKDVVGHWRKTLRHRIQIRALNFGALKGTVKMLGMDAQPLIDLEAAWRKTGKQVEDYNSGAHDASKVPISYAKEFEKELQKAIILVNMCLTKYGG